MRRRRDKYYDDYGYETEDPYESYDRYYSRRHPVRRLVIIVCVIVLALGVAFVAIPQQPLQETEGLGPRHLGTSTILLAGTDAGGVRTDTILLLTIDMLSHRMSLTSIPRDTYVDAGYSVAKINSACGYGGGGASGMEELMDQTAIILGYRPDGYVMLDFTAFEQIVDRMGGVWFLVPVDMYYVDPTQDLYIDLYSGYQKLDGAKAIQVMRFRSGYAMADLERINVQRDFLEAALKQWLKPFRLIRWPGLLSILKEKTVTDLTPREFFWIAEGVLLCHNDVEENTIPGAPKTVRGVSYYMPASPQTIRNAILSPYDGAAES